MIPRVGLCCLGSGDAVFQPICKVLDDFKEQDKRIRGCINRVYSVKLFSFLCCKYCSGANFFCYDTASYEVESPVITWVLAPGSYLWYLEGVS